MSRPQNSIMFMLIILLLLSVTLNISFSKNLKDVFTYESQCLMNKELGKTSVYWGSCLASLLMIFYIFNDFTYLMLLKEDYDFMIIDCMPSLGLIPINCLACSNEIIIPVQSQYLAMRGMTYLFETVSKVRRTINPNLRVKGILLTLVDRRANLSKNVRQELDKNYGKYVKIYDTEIPLAIKTAEASIRGKSIFEYDKKGTVAKAYENLVEEVLNDERTKS